MAQAAVSRLAVPDDLRSTDGAARNEARSSAVSWAAVIAGAFVAAALWLALLALGTGIGFSTVSPWANSGESSSTVGWAAIVWLIVMELIASSMGGYLAGRLRTKWVGVHTHEVYFRDTAHGFLVWAVGPCYHRGFSYLGSGIHAWRSGTSERDIGSRVSTGSVRG
jgi:hypothetical protein